MGYIGRGQPDGVLTSADIGEGAVTLADISFTDQPSNVNITGDYPKQTMRLCDNATVTGDVTISDGLILAKLASDGDSVTLTSDGTNRTVSGSGLIEANTIAQSPNQSLTGMTGELGSAVTGSPALNLSNATQFPAGHILQVVQATVQSNWSSSSATYVATPLQGTITPSSALNKVLVMMNSVCDTSAANRTPTLMIFRNGTAVSSASEGLMQMLDRGGGTRFPFSIHWLDSPNSTSAVTYRLYAKCGATFEMPPYGSMDAQITMLEVKGSNG